MYKRLTSKQGIHADQSRSEPGVYNTWSGYEQRVRGTIFDYFGIAGDKSETTKRSRKRVFADVEDDDECLVVNADGMCKTGRWGRPVAGIGVYWGPGDPRNIAERCPGEQTSNRASLIAIVRVLERAPVDTPKLIIKTDSKYSINCLEMWLAKWRNNGFRTSKGDPVKNVEVIKYLSALLQERSTRGQQVSLEFVQSRNGYIGNDGANAQADIGARLQHRSDPDWSSLQARASETIDVLIHVMMSRGTTFKPRSSDERPTKIPRTSNWPMFVGSSTVTNVANKPPSDSEMISVPPTRPPRSPFRPPAVRINPEPTVYKLSELSAVPVAPPPSAVVRPQTPPPDLTTLLRTTSLDSQSPPPQSTHLQPVPIIKPPKTPGSPLKASKVFAPLVPVSVSEIDFDMYKDCLLEGEEWEREIQNL